MLIDLINDFNIEYELILCKPDYTELCVLDEAININYTARFPTTDELTFSIPYYIIKGSQQIINPNWDLIKGDYLILLNMKNTYTNAIVDDKYFIIKEPELSSDEKQTKSIRCYSLEYELNSKQVRKYELMSRKLYSITNEIDDNGFQRGVMNYITTLTNWSIDTSSFNLWDIGSASKHRAFSVSEKTVFDFLINDVQPAFGCIFLFDTKNRRISVTTLDNLNNNKDLYINESNYIKTISVKPDFDEVATKLYCFGANDISINSVNPTGTNYLEDYNYYKTTDYMSQNLITALNKYEALIQYYITNKTYNNLLEDLVELQTEYTTLINELDILVHGTTLIDGIVQLQDDMDAAIKLGNDYTAIKNSLIALELQALNKMAEIDHALIDENIKQEYQNLSGNNFIPSTLIGNTKQAQINNKYAEIEAYKVSIAKETATDNGILIFTPELLVELNTFEKVKTFSDTSYENAEDLYNASVDKLARICTPPLSFSIDVVDFLSIVESKSDKVKLILGDMINISFEKFNIDYTGNNALRLISYEHSPQDNQLKLSFSTRDKLDDPYIYQQELIKNAITTSTTVDMSKFKWDKSLDNESAIASIINSDLNTASQRIINVDNQCYTLDRRGLWFYTKNESDNINPQQLRIISDSIVLTSDGFKTAGVAIDSNGVYANQLFGKSVVGVSGKFEGIEIFKTINNQSKKVIDIGNPAQYDSNNTYLIGDIVTYQGEEYICIHNISSPEAWNSSHWSLTTSSGITINSYDNLGNYKNRIVFDSTGAKFQKYLAGAFVNQLYFDTDTGNLKFVGDLTGASGTFSSSIAIGTGNNIFKVEPGTGFWIGNAVFSNAKFSVTMGGVVTAKDLTITGGTININNNFIVYSDGSVTAKSLSLTGGTININNNFYVDTSGNLTAENATIRGTIYAGAGNIGGFVINGSGTSGDPYYLTTNTNYIVLNSIAGISGISGNLESRFWAGSSYANRNLTPWETNGPSFKVDNTGRLYAKNAIISGTASNSTGIGYGVTTYGVCDIAIGYQAMSNAISSSPGGYNIAIGYRALYSKQSGNNNIALGYRTLYSNTTGYNNIAIGNNSLLYNNSGYENTAIGWESLYSNTTGISNVAMGTNTLHTNRAGNYSVAVGSGAMSFAYNTTTPTSMYNTALGYAALRGSISSSNNSGICNTSIGANSLLNNSSGSYNVALGYRTLESNSSGSYNVALGYNALNLNTTGTSNVSIGAYSLQKNTVGINNIAIGEYSLYEYIGSVAIAIGYEAMKNRYDNVESGNVGIGIYALQGGFTINNNTGIYNTAIGGGAGMQVSSGNNNTAIGYASLFYLTTYSNCTGVGSNSAVTGSNQVQLGDSATTTYAYGAVQNRSDIRDKSDIKNTSLGLNFISKLRPVDFKWDYREDYIEKENSIEEIKSKNITSMSKIKKDGSKKRNRYHHGLIAQEVKQIMDELGIDFGGYQDHSINGGEDVLSIGYNELIAPMIKAIQELKQEIDELKLNQRS